MLPQRRRERKDSERGIVCFYFEGEVSPCAPKKRRTSELLPVAFSVPSTATAFSYVSAICFSATPSVPPWMAVVLCKSAVLRNAKLAPIILHGRKMMGTAPASCLNLPKHFGSLYLEPVFFPHGQKPASAVPVFKQAILRYPLVIRGGSDNMIVTMEKTML